MTPCCPTTTRRRRTPSRCASFCDLAEREAAEVLLPRAPAARGRVEELLDRSWLTLRPALVRVERHALGCAPGVGFDPTRTGAAAAARAAAAIHDVLAAFERALTPGSGYALGHLTLAHCAAAPALWRSLRTTGLDLGPFPRLAAWREALVARPAARAEPVM